MPQDTPCKRRKRLDLVQEARHAELTESELLIANEIRQSVQDQASTGFGAKWKRADDGDALHCGKCHDHRTFATRAELEQHWLEAHHVT